MPFQVELNGVYSDAKIFNPSWKPDKDRKLKEWNKNVPTLSSFRMFCAKKVIGFDKTEFLGPLPADAPGANGRRVKFIAYIVLKSVSQLSESGMALLDEEFREVRKHRDTVESWLRKLNTIRVRIRCVKNMSAQFLSSPRFPNEFIVHTLEQHRFFFVKSMHIDTFADSVRFMERWRMYALFKQIINDNPDIPREERDVDFFIDKYMSGPYRADERYHRLIFDCESDDEVDEYGRTTRPRYLRPAHSAEILQLFALNANWFLAQQLIASREQQFVNLVKWYQFAREAEARRRSHGLGWEVQRLDPNSDVDDEDEDDAVAYLGLTQFGARASYWAQKIEYIGKLAERPPQEPMPKRHIVKPGRLNFDPDFSEESEEEYVSEPDEGTTKEIQRRAARMTQNPRVRWVFTNPIHLDEFLQWRCPFEGCPFVYDLNNLRPRDARRITSEARRVLMYRGNKDAEAPEVYSAYCEVIEYHRWKHMRANGLDFKRDPESGELSLLLCDKPRKKRRRLRKGKSPERRPAAVAAEPMEVDNHVDENPSPKRGRGRPRMYPPKDRGHTMDVDSDDAPLFDSSPPRPSVPRPPDQIVPRRSGRVRRPSQKQRDYV
ncbi:hypothetical protein FISHEDRAFT_69528 [Fistulina hepatica ATCC 64428]|uniref:Uncharacterized protein n=1 Tax=Fistulina hepatica ATCC 64428 TaxID=1128425 RepID=A0A0D7APK7_9AGAR|nr:hypothetical protein FISHEDRAFT_69528 [Fistulina hepatica ATCC 64428]